MTKSKKIMTTVLVALIPVGVFAHDGYKSNNHENNRHDSFSQVEQEKLKDANYEFEGRVESRPKTLNGTWKISGKKIIVSDKTYIFQEESSISIGDEVYIIAKREDDKIIALSLEQDD